MPVKSGLTNHAFEGAVFAKLRGLFGRVGADLLRAVPLVAASVPPGWDEEGCKGVIPSATQCKTVHPIGPGCNPSPNP
jgi:hypothetical protein